MSTNNGNGNGHEKPFERVKSPEEVAQEGLKKIAPQIRRAVRSMKIRAEVKFLFDAILDDTFMFDFGGDGHGKMLASVRDLAKRYGHDKDSITKWAEILRRKEVLWFEDRAWPYREWRITALCPAPDHRASMIQKIRARASAKRHESLSEGKGQSLLSAENGKSPSKSEVTGTSEGKVRDSVTEDRGHTDRQQGTHCPKVRDTKGGQQGTHCPKVGDRLSDASPPDAPILGDNDSEVEGALAQLQAVICGKKASGEKSPDRETLESFNNVQRCNALKRGGGEKDFLSDVKRVLSGWNRNWAEKEMINSGAAWRVKFQQNPGKATRILAETERAIKEGVKFDINPGAYAMDLWNRFA